MLCMHVKGKNKMILHSIACDTREVEMIQWYSYMYSYMQYTELVIHAD